MEKYQCWAMAAVARMQQAWINLVRQTAAKPSSNASAKITLTRYAMAGTAQTKTAGSFDPAVQDSTTTKLASENYPAFFSGAPAADRPFSSSARGDRSAGFASAKRNSDQ